MQRKSRKKKKHPFIDLSKRGELKKATTVFCPPFFLRQEQNTNRHKHQSTDGKELVLSALEYLHHAVDVRSKTQIDYIIKVLMVRTGSLYLKMHGLEINPRKLAVISEE